MRVNHPSRVVAGVALSLLSALWPGTLLAGGPDPNRVYVQSLTYGGTGCPQGTVGYSISDDRTVFTLIFDSYVASVGTGVPIAQSRKGCQLNVNLHVPQGWSYTIGDIAYRGYAQLAAGQIGTQTAAYYFSGSSNQARVSTPISGPVAKDYLIGDRLGMETMVWSACNAAVPLNIKTGVAIAGNSNSNGQLSTDSTDGKFKTMFGLQWKNC